jgi:hypothetical protein
MNEMIAFEKDKNLTHIVSISGDHEFTAYDLLKMSLTLLERNKDDKPSSGREFAIVRTRVEEAMAYYKVHLSSFVSVNSVYDKPNT